MDLLKRSNRSIAITRSTAPMVWAVIIDIVLRATGVDLSSLNDNIEQYVVVVLGIALYLLGKFRPGLLEQILLLVKVDDTQYKVSGSGDGNVVPNDDGHEGDAIDHSA